MTPSGPEAEQAVFAALADPTRRAVLRAVAQTGGSTATQLSSQFPVTLDLDQCHACAERPVNGGMRN